MLETWYELFSVQAWHIWSTMALRLRYRGTLPPSGNSTSSKAKKDIKADKQRIRLYLHEQIKRYMDDPSWHAFLLSKSDERQLVGNWQFQPIICPRPPLSCELEIRITTPRLFGSVLEKQGDLDNRLKTLFDALRPPQGPQDLPKDAQPDKDHGLVYTLVSNDSLITDLIIKTELDFTRIVEPTHPEVHPEIELDIYIRLRNPYDLIVS